MVVDLLRIYLLFGLVVHKAVWELLKRRSEAAPTKNTISLKVRLIKAAKIAILAGVFIQTLAPEFLRVSDNPAILRAVGAVLFTLGLTTALLGRIQLGDNWLDIETASVKVEQTTVTHGVYRYVRHPIYAGDLLLLFGLELALNSWGVVFVLLLAPVILRQAVREEEMLKQTLPGYDLYCRRTRRFIPFLA
jgi:protein-S-isoprenylcysteine O-methyltransferase Ste14